MYVVIEENCNQYWVYAEFETGGIKFRSDIRRYRGDTLEVARSQARHLASKLKTPHMKEYLV